MDVNDDAGCLEKRVGFIASKGNAVIQIVRVIVNVHLRNAARTKLAPTRMRILPAEARYPQRNP
jgi:hypothetical protein